MAQSSGATAQLANLTIVLRLIKKELRPYVSVRSTVQRELLRGLQDQPGSSMGGLGLGGAAGVRAGGGRVSRSVSPFNDAASVASAGSGVGGGGASLIKTTHTVLNLLWCMIGASLVRRLRLAGSRIERVSQLGSCALHWAKFHARKAATCSSSSAATAMASSSSSSPPSGGGGGSKRSGGRGTGQRTGSGDSVLLAPDEGDLCLAEEEVEVLEDICGEAWMSGRLLLALLVRSGVAKRASAKTQQQVGGSGAFSKDGDVFFRSSAAAATNSNPGVTTVEMNEWKRLLASSKIVQDADGFSGGSKVACWAAA